jgi:hypothetical protein
MGRGARRAGWVDLRSNSRRYNEDYIAAISEYRKSVG